MKNGRIFLLTLALLGLSVSGVDATTFIITKNGSNQFIVTVEGGGELNSPNTSLQTKIDQIRNSANGQNCTIQFGQGGANTLDLGGGSGTLITFEGNWGEITLTGRATSACSTSNGIIQISSGSVICEARLTATADNTTLIRGQLSIRNGSIVRTTGNNSKTIYCSGISSSTVNISDCTVEATGTECITIHMNNGTLNITDGEVNATGASSVAVDGRDGEPTINISGGIVQATGDNSFALRCAYSVNITGGTVKATAATGVAIYRYNGSSKLIVSNSAFVTSANTSAVSGTIDLISVGTNTGTNLEITGGTVENTTTTGNAVHNDSTGAVEISGGTVKVLNGMGVRNNNTGTINISGGLVTGTHGRAVRNESSGAVNISGGTVSSDTWVAVVNYANGKITVSDNAFISSAMVNNNEFGTIYQFNTGADTDCRIEITGGTIKNTSNGVAVYNNSAGAVNISGGKIIARGGYAVCTTGTGELNISGGAAFAYGTGVDDVISGDYTQTGNSVILTWNKPSGMQNYNSGSNTDIFKFPGETTASWARQSGINGITYNYNSVSGFLPVDEVWIDGLSEIVSTKLNNQLQIYPNPTTGQLRIINYELRDGIEVFDVNGRCVETLRAASLRNGTIDVSHLPAGVYFLRVDGQTVRFVKK